MPNRDFFSLCGECIHLRYIAMLYTYSIGNQQYNTMVVFKMRYSVLRARYSSVCNVLRQWRIWLIPTYRIYRLYNIIIINPRRACAARVTVLVLSFCLSVFLSFCLSVRTAILAVRAIKNIMKDTIVLSVRFAAILK